MAKARNRMMQAVDLLRQAEKIPRDKKNIAFPLSTAVFAIILRKSPESRRGSIC